MKQPSDLYTRDFLDRPKRGRPKKPDAMTPAERARRYRAKKRAEPPVSLAKEPVGWPVFDSLPIPLQWALRAVGITNDRELSVAREGMLVQKVRLTHVQARDLVCRAAAATHG